MQEGRYGKMGERTALWSGGCSAISWETLDGKHLWGRNFDFNRMAQESGILYLPAQSVYYTCGSRIEGNILESSRSVSRYRILGMGSTALGSTPTLFEGVNECGLMGGQLYYRGFAAYPSDKKRRPLQPAFAVTDILAQCASVKEAEHYLKEEISLSGMPILGQTACVHWMFSDLTGEAMVVEPDREGLRIYRDSMGVLANSPSYLWHCENLLNYTQIQPQDRGERILNGKTLVPFFSGSGALGLPGDYSSPSRFVRLAFLREYGQKGRNERQGVSYLFRLLSAVAFPMGMVEVKEEAGVLDQEVSRWDYTIYTAVLCGESGSYYWASYENPEIFCISLEKLRGEQTLWQLKEWREGICG